MAFGTAAAVAGVWISYETDTPSGGTIVLTAIAVFVLVAAATSLRRPHARSSSHVHAVRR
jgi:zinc transport system permease protein